MRKVRILGIAPYRGLVHLMNQCAAHYPDIELNAMLGNMEEGLALAKKYYSGYDMIISRANTASNRLQRYQAEYRLFHRGSWWILELIIMMFFDVLK